MTKLTDKTNFFYYLFYWKSDGCPPERVWRSTWLDFSSQGPPFTSVVDTLSSGGKVPVKEGRDELDFWLVLAT